MITTAKEYFEALWRLNDGNMPSTALLLPKEESIYQINLDNRMVEAPATLGVKADQTAETIYFVCDRYYSGMDLSNTSCAVIYKNAKEEYGIYPIPFYDIETFSGESPYVRINLTEDTYQIGKYYIKDENDKYLLSDTIFDKDAEYYSFDPTDKHFIKAYVEYSNYQKDVYYIKQDDKYVKATGGFDSKEDYYNYVECPKILFPWILGGRATTAPGKLEYMIQFYSLDPKDTSKYLYRLNTKISKAEILDTMIVDIKDTEEELGEIKLNMPTWQEDINDKINKMWKAFPGTDDDPNNDFKGYEMYWIEA